MYDARYDDTFCLGIDEAQQDAHDEGKRHLRRIEVYQAECQCGQQNGGLPRHTVAGGVADESLTEDQFLNNRADNGYGKDAPRVFDHAEKLHLHRIGQVEVLAQHVSCKDAENSRRKGRRGISPFDVHGVDRPSANHPHTVEYEDGDDAAYDDGCGQLFRGQGHEEQLYGQPGKQL